MEHSIERLRLAAAMTCAALDEVLPGSELLESGETAVGFFCRFTHSQPPLPETTSMLEEAMRQIVRENRPVRSTEMVACSAGALFAAKGRLAAAAKLQALSPKQLVSLAWVGDFCTPVEGPCGESIGAFRLFPPQQMGDNEYLIEGCAFPSKEELKQFLRKRSLYAEGNHLAVGERLGWWKRIGEHLLWKQRGLVAKRAVYSLWRDAAPAQELATAARGALDLFAAPRVKPGAPFQVWCLEEKLANPEESEGLLAEDCQSVAQQIIYCEKGDLSLVITSLLQTIEKTHIILGFEGSSSSDFQWIVKDGLDRPHVVTELIVEKGHSGFVVCMKVGVERILSLLLEQRGGNLPAWIS